MTHAPLPLKLTAYLLQYPNRAWRQRLGQVRQGLAGLGDTPTADRLMQFVEELRKLSLTAVQELYTQAFDLNAPTCLNLTYHLWGERKERGKALALFCQLYSEAGYECIAEELPDFLPVILEFLAERPDRAELLPLARLAEAAGRVARQLKTDRHAYGPLVEAAAELLERQAQACRRPEMQHPQAQLRPDPNDPL